MFYKLQLSLDKLLDIRDTSSGGNINYMDISQFNTVAPVYNRVSDLCVSLNFKEHGSFDLSGETKITS